MAKKRGRPVKKPSARSRRGSSRPRASKPRSRSRAVKSRTASSRRSVSSGRSSRAARNVVPTRDQSRNNLRLVVNNLVIFFLLFVISIILTQVLSYSVILENLFAIFSIAFAFIAIAFLITLLVFLFLRFMHKKQ